MPETPQSTRQAKVISLHRLGRLANSMIQYMAALKLSRRIPGSVITGANLREWSIPLVENPDPSQFDEILVVSPSNAMAISTTEIVSISNRSSSVNIVLEDHMQRMEFIDDPRSYADVFPASPRGGLGEKDLLIHIRTEDILVGVDHYPLLPINYYHWLVHITGLNPVFCGQIDGSNYVQLLRAQFPKARFIETADVIGDFQTIRSAANIALSVSTFCWLAALLSEAKTIFLPLCGFFSPAIMREFDLLPTDDPRFRFIQFPLFFGVEQNAMLEHHRRIDSTWKEISLRQVMLLRDASPFLAPRLGDIPFDRVWYAHTYLDAAQEISEGWFEGPLHHYLEVGRLRGHQPTRNARSPAVSMLPGRNLARSGHAVQSSVSRWSQGKTVEIDAAIAINGRVWEDKFFHTNDDVCPWWRVDLQVVCLVSAIRIFNREALTAVQLRASPLHVEGSIDGQNWFNLFQTDPGHLFGGRSGNPLQWTTLEPVRTRFVKVMVPKQEFLHLAEVEVYGAEEPEPS
jgi:hypothetical protein